MWLKEADTSLDKDNEVVRALMGENCRLVDAFDRLEGYYGREYKSEKSDAWIELHKLMEYIEGGNQSQLPLFRCECGYKVRANLEYW